MMELYSLISSVLGILIGEEKTAGRHKYIVANFTSFDHLPANQRFQKSPYAFVQRISNTPGYSSAFMQNVVNRSYLHLWLL
jgi:hypothetical protein